MRKFFQLLMVVAVLLAGSLNAFSQTTPTSTTLSAAIADERTTRFTVASATGFVASSGTLDYGVFIDREFMRITAVSGTTITVNRARSSTSATSHRSGARVWVGQYGSSAAGGQTGGPFVQGPLYGSCTASRQPYLPVIQVNASALDGQAMYNCNNGQWARQTLLDDVLPMAARYCTANISGFSLLTTFVIANGVTLGTNTTPVSATVYYATLNIPQTMLLTGISALNGTVAATDSLKYTLYRADGTPLATTAGAGTTATGIDQFQDIAFTATYLATGPARYWVSVVTNGTTTRLRTIPSPTSAAANAFTGILASSATSTFNIVGTQNLIGIGNQAVGGNATTALPTTQIGDVGPIACVY